MVNEYFSNFYHCQLLNEWDLDAAPGNVAIRVKKVHILPDSDEPVINITTPLEVVTEFLICQDSVTINYISMALKNIKGDYIFVALQSSSASQKDSIRRLCRYREIC